MSPDFTFAQTHNQLPCMLGNMACHHNHVADNGTESATIYLMACFSSANGFLSNHPQDIVGKNGQFKQPSKSWSRYWKVPSPHWQRIKATYGEKYDPMLMYDSKQDVANLLHEEAEARSVRELLRQKQQSQKQNKKKNRDLER